MGGYSWGSLWLAGMHPSPPMTAVKFIDKKALTAEDLAALEVEVKAMEILSSHPNFVRLYDFFAEKVRRVQRLLCGCALPHIHSTRLWVAQDFFYVCMELISGGELFDRIVQKEKYSERGEQPGGEEGE